MRKLRATAFVWGLAFLPLTSPCQTAPAPPQGMQMCITGGGSGKVPGCLTQKDASTDALVVMTKDLTIEHSNVESSKVSGSVDPIFAATKEGLR